MHYRLEALIVYFAKCQGGMTVTLLALAQEDVAADPALEPTLTQSCLKPSNKIFRPS